MMRRYLLTLCLLLGAHPAYAEPALPAAYALIIGSNLGGPGQAPLRYAEQDAQRVSELLATLGDYPTERITQLLAPNGAQLEAALSSLEATLQAHADAGEPTRFFFYYSGHARADALNLGAEQVALAALKQRIVALPATLSIAVLDACQSGSFARAKGAGQTADFSFNMVEQLRTEGIAVIASSSGQELSQESDELRAGHFTHHLMVGLRGAGDVDADGAVTLSEAYTYAYNRTLATTALTTIGEQHVTLENDLTGHGDVALTHPAQASAHLIVPAALRGRVLVQRLPSFSVVAELDKASGDRVRLALPEGRYLATVRLPNEARRCPFALAHGDAHELTLVGCQVIPLTVAVAKGAASSTWRDEKRPPAEPESYAGDEGFFFELGLGVTRHPREDAFAQRLSDFGFGVEDELIEVDAELSAGRRLHENLAFGVSYFDLDALTYQRTLGDPQHFEYDSFGLASWVQGDYGLVRARTFNLFVRAGIGLALASTEFDALVPLSQHADDSPLENGVTGAHERIEQSFSGACFSIGGGVQLMPFSNGGFTLHVRYTYAPILDNALGDSHDVGGLTAMFGLRFRTWETP